MDDQEPIPCSDSNLMSEVFKAGAKLNIGISPNSSKITYLLIASLRAHARVPDLKSRVSVIEVIVDALRLERGDPHVSLVPCDAQAEEKEKELVNARKQTEELVSQVINASSSNNLLIESLRAKVPEHRSAEATT